MCCINVLTLMSVSQWDCAKKAVLPCELGDVLVMEGRRLVHSSPAVAEDGAVRVICYVWYERTRKRMIEREMSLSVVAIVE